MSVSDKGGFSAVFTNYTTLNQAFLDRHYTTLPTTGSQLRQILHYTFHYAKRRVGTSPHSACGVAGGKCLCF